MGRIGSTRILGVAVVMLLFCQFLSQVQVVRGDVGSDAIAKLQEKVKEIAEKENDLMHMIMVSTSLKTWIINELQLAQLAYESDNSSSLTEEAKKELRGELDAFTTALFDNQYSSFLELIRDIAKSGKIKDRLSESTMFSDFKEEHVLRSISDEILHKLSQQENTLKARVNLLILAMKRLKPFLVTYKGVLEADFDAVIAQLSKTEYIIQYTENLLAHVYNPKQFEKLLMLAIKIQTLKNPTPEQVMKLITEDSGTQSLLEDSSKLQDIAGIREMFKNFKGKKLEELLKPRYDDRNDNRGEEEQEQDRQGGMRDGPTLKDVFIGIVLGVGLSVLIFAAVRKYRHNKLAAQSEIATRNSRQYLAQRDEV